MEIKTGASGGALGIAFVLSFVGLSRELSRCLDRRGLPHNATPTVIDTWSILCCGGTEQDCDGHRHELGFIAIAPDFYDSARN